MMIKYKKSSGDKTMEAKGWVSKSQTSGFVWKNYFKKVIDINLLKWYINKVAAKQWKNYFKKVVDNKIA